MEIRQRSESCYNITVQVGQIGDLLSRINAVEAYRNINYDVKTTVILFVEYS